MRKLLMLVALVALAACSKVTQYEVAVKENTWSGKVSDKIYGQGLYPAFFVSYKKFPLREVQFPRGDKQANAVTALTSDQLNIRIEAAYRYRISPDSARSIYLSIGNDDAVHEFVYSAYREAVRDAVARIPATQLLSRSVDGIDVAIAEKLSETVNDRGIEITEFFLRDIDPPDRIVAAIESKLAREQQVEEQRFATQVVVEQANQKREEAAGIRDAQNIIAESLDGVRGQRYLYWRYMEVLGEIGKGENNMVIAPTEGGVPIFIGQ